METRRPEPFDQFPDKLSTWEWCLRDYDKLCVEFAVLKKENELLANRAGKLLKRGTPFLVVAEHEPYYLRVYTMIREQEQKQGTWTNEDEERYTKASRPAAQGDRAYGYLCALSDSEETGGGEQGMRRR